MNISVCIPAYNEEQDIAALLNSFAQQKTSTVTITQIIVVASGCTDNTVQVVQKLQREIPHLSIIIQKERKGKASAINAFLKEASGNICVVSSADLLLQPDTLEQLCLPFKKSDIGMTGGHPIPLNKPTRFIPFVVHILWEIHHERALKSPKCGEIIAFRKIFERIPSETPVDEASIEAEIVKNGLTLAYAPKAVVHNKGPETIRDFIRQRRRINFGHIWLKKHTGHHVSTTKYSAVFPLFIKKFDRNFRHIIWLLGLATLESWSKFLAWIDYHSGKKSYTLWEQIQSSKNLNEL